ncbi:MAG: hypothetical protein CMP82_06725 [Gammaproteobacteria bacterium]|nr:hypothetical protein [Gammaproteobacteria bacterium]
MPALSHATYVTRSLQKISGKRWELYVVSRVLHVLNDPEIEFICQQYINPPKNKDYYLADLAFPSLKLYLEIDEGQHGKLNHQLADAKRDAEIFEATDWECQRIKVFVKEGGQHKDKTLARLNEEIDKFVNIVKAKKERLVLTGTWEAWNYERKFMPQAFIDKGYISVSDNVAFLNHRDALRLFGYHKGHYQRAVWKINKTSEIVWFPKLYPNSEWVNEFDTKTNTICQYRQDKKPMPMPSRDASARIVFAHQKNVFGQTVYKFYGLFEPDFKRTNPVFHYFKRVKTVIRLSRYW